MSDPRRGPRRGAIVASGNGAGALAAGIAVLSRGGTAIDAVEACARAVELDPSELTVGLGGKPNVIGQVELDASIMDGSTRAAGGVAGLQGFLHPISVARSVMEQLPHVLLVGAGAARFATEIGAQRARLLTSGTRALWAARLGAHGLTPTSVRRRTRLAPIVWKMLREERGTVNFIAVDGRGRMASAVTTSGWAYKYPGRVGDSAIVGAGNYCDGRYGGAACTGFGELAMRCLTAKFAVDQLAAGGSAEAAASAAIVAASSLRSPEQWLNVIVLTPDGTPASATTDGATRFGAHAYQRTDMSEPALTPARLIGSRAPREPARPRTPSRTRA